MKLLASVHGCDHYMTAFAFVHVLMQNAPQAVERNQTLFFNSLVLSCY